MLKTPFRSPIVEERDACAIIAFIDKHGRASHANIVKTVEALKKMAHRSGDIDNEGDGCGLLMDVPRDIWGKRLEEQGFSRHLAESRSFFVGHFFLPLSLRAEQKNVFAKTREVFAEQGMEIVLDVVGETRDKELGPRAQAEAPLFWQVGGMLPAHDDGSARAKLFRIQLELEQKIPEMHIASLSPDSVVYKVRGMPDLLLRVYPDLISQESRSVITLGHSRYSTNTLPTVERAQPFSVVAHNGEINTIERLRSAGRVMGIEPAPDGSDSQDLNRIIEGLINLYDFDPLEALEIVFPAIHTAVEQYSPKLQDVYSFYRWFFQPSAQGPAAIIARAGNTVMGSVDAMGLRPLWFGESDYDYYLSSEKGVVDLKNTISDAKPLAPGEKIALLAGRGRDTEVLDYGSIQKRLVAYMESAKDRGRSLKSLYRELPNYAGPEQEPVASMQSFLPAGDAVFSAEEITSTKVLGAYGWQKFDVDLIKETATKGRDVIGSMGHQGPLAAMMPEALPNASEYFKENVAVVTNPAIDREREADHFSTKTILGDRPDSKGKQKPSAVGLELRSPVLLGGGVEDVIPVEVTRRIAEKYGTFILEDVLSFFTADGKDMSRVHTLDATFEPAGCLKERMGAICNEAVEAVKNGAVIILVDDSRSFDGDKVYVDPGLAATTLVKRLDAEGIRRKCSLIVRSAAVRNLHDVMFLLGLGIDAVNPYMIQRVTADFVDEKRDVEKLVGGIMDILQKGMEKVMSTMGIHELCGYGRIFASIGLTEKMAEIFQCPNFCASESTGLSYKRLVALAKMRQERIRSDKNAPLWKDKPRNVRVGKVLRAAALGESGWKAMADGMAEIDAAIPNAVRHMLTVKTVDPEERTPLERVDISVKTHDIPVTIPAMSFGSQGENSFRSYAEAAKRANIVCINGEGGEIPDMLGKYRKNRGQQIASGRFGVYMGFLNSADFLEIKIGQGAKPGEGGHLPGAKVSEMVARARHCKPGIPLISPSNHHDIYSIEDLQQIITELKTANPLARISVKIPVTSGVGTIAVGIAKAGADIVSVSGFDGGTGAAREHAKKYTGLPAEIGVAHAHRALVESGLRDKVEIWADGGCRSGDDVVKMILLGADRVGMGTLSLMGVGCVSCHRCHLDRCPRGISTQLRDVKDAESKGVVNFRLVEHEEETANLTRLLMALGESIRMIVSHMGETTLSDLVGRTDLLEQTRFNDELDVSELLLKPCGDEGCEYAPYRTIARRPLNYLTKLVSDLSMEQFQKGHNEVNFADEEIKSTDRAMGTYLAGAISRAYGNENKSAQLRLSSSIPGNGLGAFNTTGIDIDVAGGSQDGTAKSSFGGTVKVLKGVNLLGRPVDGSTGKSFAYGAIGGTLIIQNYADSRACVRMSGADVVFGARITEPTRDEEGNIASRSHLKGFAFEYMTGGRVVVLGDPGPWICSGMTGGVVYQCLYPELGFTKDSITRRLATGADVVLKNMDAEGMDGLKKLLSAYIWELNNSWQTEEADAVSKLLADADKRFVMIVPRPKSPPRPE